jgi:hypothetical protein
MFLVIPQFGLCFHYYVFYLIYVKHKLKLRLFVLMYLVCSQCHFPTELPVWPTYEQADALNFSLYMLLEFILFCGILSQSWLYKALVV